MRRDPVLQVNLRSAGRKLFAAGAAVAISVAFIVAGMLMVDAFNRGLTQQLEAEAAGADLILDTTTLSAWDEDTEEYLRDDLALADEIQQLDAVEVADPIGSGYLSEITEDGAASIGLEVGEQSATRIGEISEGRAAEADDEVVVSSAAATGRGVEIGTTLTAELYSYEEDAGPDAEPTIIQEEYTVVGVVDVPGQPFGYLTPEGMDRLPSGASPAEIRILLDSDSSADAAQVQEQVKDLIAAQAETLGGSRSAELSGLQVQTT